MNIFFFFCEFLTYKRDWLVVTRSDMTYYIWHLMSFLASYRSNQVILERCRTYLFLNFSELRKLFKMNECVGIKLLG